MFEKVIFMVIFMLALGIIILLLEMARDNLGYFFIYFYEHRASRSGSQNFSNRDFYIFANDNR